MRKLALCGLVAVLGCANEATDGGAEGEPLGSIASAITLTPVSGFGSNPGQLVMYKYVPAGLPTNAPLVVVLHGCTQTANEYGTRADWNALADRFAFAVAYAEQATSNNSNRCFNWFQTGDISRGQGEALSIKQMVDKMKTDHGSNPARIFVTGLSAGGYMTEVMLAAYPDVFAGGAVMAGGAYKCATSLLNTSMCQQGNVSRTPGQWGDLVRGAFSGYSGPYPRVVAFHGSSDFTVYPANMTQTVDQWTNVHGADNTADVTETFRTSTHRVYRNSGGTSVVETYLIASMGHAVSVDPGAAVDQGGATGAFSEDRDIYSSYYSAVFFGLTSGGGGGGDTVAPTVNVTSPANGSSQSGTINVTASASDNVGVTRVELWIDGVLRDTDFSSPYSFALDTTTLSNGAHAVSARAYDAATNIGIDADTSIVVSNGGGGPTGLLETFSAGSGPDNPGWTLGGWSLDASRDATGAPGSKSIAAVAQPAFNTVTRTATWAGVALGAAPTLSYKRQLALSNANIFASSSFKVIVNDGADHVVDTQAVTGLGSYNESSWTARAGIGLGAYANQTVTLKFVVTAQDSMSIVTSARAWVDQIDLH